MFKYFRRFTAKIQLPILTLVSHSFPQQTRSLLLSLSSFQGQHIIKLGRPLYRVQSSLSKDTWAASATGAPPHTKHAVYWACTSFPSLRRTTNVSAVLIFHCWLHEELLLKHAVSNWQPWKLGKICDYCAALHPFGLVNFPQWRFILCLTFLQGLCKSLRHM